MPVKCACGPQDEQRQVRAYLKPEYYREAGGDVQGTPGCWTKERFHGQVGGWGAAQYRYKKAMRRCVGRSTNFGVTTEIYRDIRYNGIGQIGHGNQLVRFDGLNVATDIHSSPVNERWATVASREQ